MLRGIAMFLSYFNNKNFLNNIKLTEILNKNNIALHIKTICKILIKICFKLKPIIPFYYPPS